MVMRRAVTSAFLVGGAAAASAPAEKGGTYTLHKYDCGQDATCTKCTEKFSVVNKEGCSGPIAPGGGAYINHQCGPDGSFYRIYADAQCTDAASSLKDFPNNACKKESGTFVKYYSDCNALVSAESVVAAAADGGTIKLNWSDCGDSSTHGHITSLSPTSVVLGTKTSLVGKGKIDKAIPAASYKVVAKEGFIPVFSHSGDACKPDTIKLPAGAGELDMKGFKCPLSTGSVELDLDLTLSSSIPAKLARVTIELTAQSSSGDKALCAKINTSPEHASEMMGLVANPDCEKEYESFLKAFPEKKPSPEGYANFCSNLEVIEKHNSANAGWSMGVNEFSDWTDDQKKILLGWDMTGDNAELPAFQVDPSDEVAAGVDWRSKMPAVKSQGHCGSCWAFSAIDVVDFFGGSHSEEELVDCYKKSCHGGDPRLALQYLSQKGVASESGYRYTAGSGHSGQCHHFAPVAKVSNVQGVSGESSIVSALQHQVVSVCFHLQEEGSPFMNYHRGVYDQECGTGAGHCVAAVGYASDYWIIRNSWGSGWGQNGHVFFKKGSNLCGMESHGTVALAQPADAALVVV